jgi:hypothetical protein
MGDEAATSPPTRDRVLPMMSGLQDSRAERRTILVVLAGLIIATSVGVGLVYLAVFQSTAADLTRILPDRTATWLGLHLPRAALASLAELPIWREAGRLDALASWHPNQVLMRQADDAGAADVAGLPAPLVRDLVLASERVEFAWIPAAADGALGEAFVAFVAVPDASLGRRLRTRLEAHARPVERFLGYRIDAVTAPLWQRWLGADGSAPRVVFMDPWIVIAWGDAGVLADLLTARVEGREDPIRRRPGLDPEMIAGPRPGIATLGGALAPATVIEEAADPSRTDLLEGAMGSLARVPTFAGGPISVASTLAAGGEVARFRGALGESAWPTRLALATTPSRHELIAAGPPESLLAVSLSTTDPATTAIHLAAIAELPRADGPPGSGWLGDAGLALPETLWPTPPPREVRARLIAAARRLTLSPGGPLARGAAHARLDSAGERQAAPPGGRPAGGPLKGGASGPGELAGREPSRWADGDGPDSGPSRDASGHSSGSAPGSSGQSSGSAPGSSGQSSGSAPGSSGQSSGSAPGSSGPGAEADSGGEPGTPGAGRSERSQPSDSPWNTASGVGAGGIDATGEAARSAADTAPAASLRPSPGAPSWEGPIEAAFFIVPTARAHQEDEAPVVRGTERSASGGTTWTALARGPDPEALAAGLHTALASTLAAATSAGTEGLALGAVLRPDGRLYLLSRAEAGPGADARGEGAAQGRTKPDGDAPEPGATTDDGGPAEDPRQARNRSSFLVWGARCGLVIVGPDVAGFDATREAVCRGSASAAGGPAGPTRAGTMQTARITATDAAVVVYLAPELLAASAKGGLGLVAQQLAPDVPLIASFTHDNAWFDLRTNLGPWTWFGALASASRETLDAAALAAWPLPCQARHRAMCRAWPHALACNPYANIRPTLLSRACEALEGGARDDTPGSAP